MDLQACPHCGIQVIPRQDGSCPSCGQTFDNWPNSNVPFAAEEPAAKPDPPQLRTDYSPPPPPSAPKEPFSHQAAKFSVYAPFILIMMGYCLQPSNHKVTTRIALTTLAGLTTLAAFILGGIGLFGGIQRRAVRTILFAFFGLIVNGCVVAVWAFAIFFLLTMNPDQRIVWATVSGSTPPFSVDMPRNPKEQVFSEDTPDGEVTTTSYESYDGVVN